MLKKIHIIMIVTILICPCAVMAEEANVSGTFEPKALFVGDKNNSAKFQEYRDLDDGGSVDFMLEAYKNSYYIEFSGENAGLDNQSYLIQGGNFNKFKFKLNYDETPHNYYFDARSFYSGIDTGTLDYSATNRAKNADAGFTPAIGTDPNTWTSFDYAIKRKKIGGELEISMSSPFYLSLGANQLETSGTKPLGQPSGVYADSIIDVFTTFGNIIEMPEPVDYKTNVLFAEFGYRSKDMRGALKIQHSNFENDIDYLTWRNPYVSTEDFYEVSSLPPDNEFWKFEAEGSLRLPMSSLLAARVSYSKQENDFTVRNTIAYSTEDLVGGNSPTYAIIPLGLNRNTFDGDIATTKLGLSLASRPTKEMYTKFYYSYLDKDNDSTIIEYTNGGSTTESQLFEYEDNTAGLDVDYKLSRYNKLSAGYTYKDVDRKRDDATSSTDNIIYLEWKNTTLDFLSAKLRYQRMDRDSGFNNHSAGANANDPDYINRFLRRFDVTDKTEDKIKLSFELYPTEKIDIGLEYNYKKNDYDETTLGRTEDVKNEYYVDVSWRPATAVTLNGFFGYEDTDADSSHRYVSGGGNNDPTITPNGTDFNWTESLDDDYWAYGLTASFNEVASYPLDFFFSWEHQESDGEATFTSQQGLLEDITQYDDYTKKLFEGKALYTFSEQLKFTLGYIWEKYELANLQYDGYTNYDASLPFGANGAFLTGAYANQNYEANIVYILASSSF